MLRRVALPQRVWSILSIVLVVSLVLGQAGPAYSSSAYHSWEAKPATSMRYRADSDVIMPYFGGPENGDSDLEIILSDGAPVPEAAEPLPPVAPAEPLSDAETQAIVDRLPTITVQVTDTQEFRFPAETLPPPVPGTTVDEPFPLPEDAPAPEQEVPGALEVVRYAPEGEIQIAPFLNVTFNQPMVALGTLEQLSAADVPVKLTPEIPGVWKWLGTKTLSFEYTGGEFDRFPMATEYTVEVPAGTTSAIGGVLAEDVRWTFTTPAPQITYTAPSYGPQRRDPLLFAAFNQKIDPAAVLETVNVTAGSQSYPVRLATPEEIAADKAVTRLSEISGEGRWLAFRAEEEFPANITVNVSFGPGVPSSEGPLTTDVVQAFSFQTYAPLRITEHRCGYSDTPDDCPPYTPFEIVFNNPLDGEAFDQGWFTVTPEIPGLVVNNYGSSVSLQGATVGRTTYQVTVSGDVRDAFGQTLGQDTTLKFTTGSMPEMLQGPGSNLVTLDPSAPKPTFSVYTVNYSRLRVRAYAVQPEDWTAYLDWQNRFYSGEYNAAPPGEEVLSKFIEIAGEPDALTETMIDLSDAYDGKPGHLIVVVDRPRLFGRQDPYNGLVQAWVQWTQIGLDAFVDYQDMVVWTTSLMDGAPLADVSLTLQDANISGGTNAEGTAQLSLSDTPAPVLIARRGDDSAILPQSNYYWYPDGWRKNYPSDWARWYVFDDRGMYRPGEEVHLKGWVRRVGGTQEGDVGLLRGVSSLRYQVTDPQGNQLEDGMADVSSLGGFDFAFTLPEGANLGYANVYLSIPGGANISGTDYYHTFQIQEFRRPEFEVTARPEGEGPYFIGDDATVAVTAQYFAGGPLPNADTTWNVSSTPTSYSPPNWPDFIFGKWQPWWYYGGVDVYARSYVTDMGYGVSAPQQTFANKTDAAGVSYLNMQFVDAREPRPYSVTAEGVVMDVNRQAWASSVNLLVHPASLYVGLRSNSTFVNAGDPLEIEAIVTDIDGNAVEDRPIEMTAARQEWKVRNGQWLQEDADPQDCTVGSTTEPVSCTFTTEVGGEYRITATVTDSQGRQNLSEFTRWVSGGQIPPSRNIEQEQITLIPDKENYQPGDTAEILVQAPWTPAEGLVTLSRNGIVSTERFHMDEPTYVVRVPIEEAYLPNINVAVDLTGAAPRTDDEGEPLADVAPRPAYASGTLNLNIPPLTRALTMTIAPAETELEPGGETSIAIDLKDAQGEPVADAELAVVVVDEAILALTNYTLADPLAVFYQTRSSDVSSYYGRASLVLASPQVMLEKESLERMPMATAAPGVGGGMAEMDAAIAPAAMPMEEAAADSAQSAATPQAQPITLRTNFNPLALFAPEVTTDAEGHATVDVKLPDNLTRYRIMVVAVADGKQFGAAEANLTARLPLMVRAAAPRFLNFGDRFDLPIVLQNQTDEPMQVDVAVSVGNLTLTGAAGQRIEVPANDRREVRFPATTNMAGTARVQIGAVAGDYADAAAVELPVYTPATTEAFATYGVVDEGSVAQPILTPTGVFTQFGGLEVNTSSTALQALTDATLYLISYPFECSEQLASRILGISSLRDVLTAFEAKDMPSPALIDLQMARDIGRLQQMQNDDGGFPIWERGKPSQPYYSVFAMHALQYAKLKDYAVSQDTLTRGLDYLRRIEDYYPDWYSEMTRHALSSYAVYVRDLMGDTDTVKARTLLDQYPLDDQSLEAISWLWQVLSGDPASTAQVEEIRRHINNQAVETAGAANFYTSYGDDEWVMLHSDRRTDAIVLDALINDEPESDLIPKVVTGLLAHRNQGRWDNTQENVFVLIALDRYFNTFESVTPDFVARVWLGDTYIAEHVFEGYSDVQRSTTVPTAWMVENADPDGTTDLIVAKEGDGRLYYRIGMRYAPEDLNLTPLDMGFVVQRTYEAVDDPDDVTRDADGVWHFKLGARVRVRVDMVATTRRYHVALVDPLPAGLEAINPALAVSESIPADPNAASSRRTWWWGPWYEHQNLRDQRAEAFTSLLWDGVYQYSYVGRATTPGEYVVPPAKAEEMYFPEVFGRSGSDRVVVE